MKLIAEILSFSLCSVLARTWASGAVSDAIINGRIKSPEVGTAFVMIAAVAGGLAGVAIVHLWKSDK